MSLISTLARAEAVAVKPGRPDGHGPAPAPRAAADGAGPADHRGRGRRTAGGAGRHRTGGAAAAGRAAAARPGPAVRVPGRAGGGGAAVPGVLRRRGRDRARHPGPRGGRGLRRRPAADRAQLGGRGVRTAAGPLHALSPHGGGGPGHALPGTGPRAAARAVADALRGAGPHPRLVAAARDDRPADQALGDRPEQPGGPAPGRAAGLDRPAGRHDRPVGRPPGGVRARGGRAAALPMRPGPPPTRRSTTPGSPRP